MFPIHNLSNHHLGFEKGATARARHPRDASIPGIAVFGAACATAAIGLVAMPTSAAAQDDPGVPAANRQLVSQVFLLRELKKLHLSAAQIRDITQRLSQLAHAENDYAAHEAAAAQPVAAELKRVETALQEGQAPDTTDQERVDKALAPLRDEQIRLERTRTETIDAIRQALTREQLNLIRQALGMGQNQTAGGYRTVTTPDGVTVLQGPDVQFWKNNGGQNRMQFRYFNRNGGAPAGEAPLVLDVKPLPDNLPRGPYTTAPAAPRALPPAPPAPVDPNAATPIAPPAPEAIDPPQAVPEGAAMAPGAVQDQTVRTLAIFDGAPSNIILAQAPTAVPTTTAAPTPATPATAAPAPGVVDNLPAPTAADAAPAPAAAGEDRAAPATRGTTTLQNQLTTMQRQMDRLQQTMEKRIQELQNEVARLQDNQQARILRVQELDARKMDEIGKAQAMEQDALKQAMAEAERARAEAPQVAQNWNGVRFAMPGGAASDDNEAIRRFFLQPDALRFLKGMAAQ